MLYRRGQIWWMGFRFGGRRFQESTRTKSKTLAREIERKRRNDLAAGLHQVRKPTTPTAFLVASKDYLTWKRPTVGPRTYEMEEHNLTHLQPVFGSLLITDITADDIADYQKRRLAEKASAKTINLEVGTLRQVLKRNRVWANLQPDVRMLLTRNDVGRVLTPGEEDKILAACAKSRSRALHPYVVLAINTGMRYSEIRLLRWRQLDLIGATLTVGASKTDAGSGRKIPLNTRALTALQSWATLFPDREPEHYIFPTEGIGLATDDSLVVAHHTKPSVPIGSIQHAWQRAQKAAGVRIRFHDLRHTACTRLLEAGVPLMVAGQLLGWAGGTVAAMAAKYGHVGPKALKDAVKALDRIPPPKPKEHKSRTSPASTSVN